MRNANENTVLATNQLPKTNRIYYLGNENAPKRLLILGNSITRHGVRESIGWLHDWGMAASAEEKDFVHLLQGKLQAAGKDVLTMVSQASLWEIGLDDPNILDEFSAERAFSADIVLFRLGENVPKGTDMVHFAACLRRFLSYVCPNGQLVMTTTVWGNPPLNAELCRAASELGAAFADIREIGSDETLMAIGQYAHKGVAMHPSDKGMAYIASAVFEKLQALL